MKPVRSDMNGFKHQRKNSKHNKGKDSSSQSSLPGVQRIKSSLRQTRRLLSKDNLAADVRIETERRLKSLESDLAKAERTRKERNFAVKYHKVKFFERQKVCRKIKQAKKELSDSESAPENFALLRETLLSLRVDLNYILHYPKAKKYISLYPPESSNAVNEVGSSDTCRQREELRRLVKMAMEKGEMDAEPEVTMDREQSHGEIMNWEEGSSPWPSAEKKGKQKEVKTAKSKGVPGDAFFEDSDGDDKEQSDDG